MLVCGVAIVMFLATSEASFPFSMERLFCVFVRYDVVRISFHFQLLWRSIIVINRGCWCRSVCFRTSSRTPPGFSVLLFFLFFVRALILSPLARVIGNVYVFSRIKVTSSGAFWLCFSTFDCRAFPSWLIVSVSALDINAADATWPFQPWTLIQLTHRDRFSLGH